jgi:methionine synthase I (cobalamin-dependent)
MSTSSPSSRSDLLRSVLSSRIAILDGAMGTMVHALGLDDRRVDVGGGREGARVQKAQSDGERNGRRRKDGAE